MIDKFLKTFQEFKQREEIQDLDEETKVKLFEIYVRVKTMKSSKPSGPKSEDKKIRKPNRPATKKQIGFLKKLVADGRIEEEPSYEDLTVNEASRLISIGVKAEKTKEEPKGNFSGAFSHQSGEFESDGDFWE